MINHIFESMNEALDEIRSEYPHAVGPRKEELMTQLQVLRSMSDQVVEQWLQFEEKLGVVRETCMENDAFEQGDESVISLSGDGEWMDAYRKGQGYYQLLMYPEAVKEFQKVTDKEPDFIMGRLYLALGYLRKGQLDDSRRQLQLVLGTTENQKVKALAHNALGCIQAKENQLDAALKHFAEASERDLQFYDPVFNQAVCLYQKESYKEAAEKCRKFLSDKESDWECMILLANCYEKMEMMDQSLSWRQVAMKVSGNVQVMLDLAYFYERTTDFENALDWFEKLLSELPWKDECRSNSV